MKFDSEHLFEQIESERKKTLELFLVVLLLGFLINIGASAVNDYFHFLWQSWFFQALYFIFLTQLILLTFVSALSAGKVKVNIPVVVFFDEKKSTISLPSLIHFPNTNKYVGVAGPKTPLPIACRLTYEKFKRNFNNDQSETLEGIKIMELMETLIEYEFIHHYSIENYFSWSPIYSLRSGPMAAGYGPDLPRKEFSIQELAKISGNIFLAQVPENLTMILPAKTIIKHESPHKFIFDNELFKVSIGIRSFGSQHMSGWKYAIGTLSTWYRELSSDYDNTLCILLELQIEFTTKVSISRYINEDWLPKFIRTKPTLQQIFLWMNSWVNSAVYYFDWVNEDIKDIPKNELSDLINESTITYKPRIKKAPLITFK